MNLSTVEWLIAKVERLQTEMAECESRCEDCERDHNAIMAERDRYKAAIEDAPHEGDCSARLFRKCDCWKADALASEVAP